MIDVVGDCAVGLVAEIVGDAERAGEWLQLVERPGQAGEAGTEMAYVVRQQRRRVALGID